MPHRLLSPAEELIKQTAFMNLPQEDVADAEQLAGTDKSQAILDAYAQPRAIQRLTEELGKKPDGKPGFVPTAVTKAAEQKLSERKAKGPARRSTPQETFDIARRVAQRRADQYYAGFLASSDPLRKRALRRKLVGEVTAFGLLRERTEEGQKAAPPPARPGADAASTREKLAAWVAAPTTPTTPTTPTDVAPNAIPGGAADIPVAHQPGLKNLGELKNVLIQTKPLRTKHLAALLAPKPKAIKTISEAVVSGMNSKEFASWALKNSPRLTPYQKKVARDIINDLDAAERANRLRGTDFILGQAVADADVVRNIQEEERGVVRQQNKELRGEKSDIRRELRGVDRAKDQALADLATQRAKELRDYKMFLKKRAITQPGKDRKATQAERDRHITKIGRLTNILNQTDQNKITRLTSRLAIVRGQIASTGTKWLEPEAIEDLETEKARLVEDVRTLETRIETRLSAYRTLLVEPTPAAPPTRPGANRIPGALPAAPDGTRKRRADGTIVVKRGGTWVPE